MTAPSDLVAMLSVIDSGARTQEDILTGPPHPTPHGRSFGGQVVGQAIAAGGTTVPEDRHIHSMHGYFLRPGSSSERMTFEVARLHDGRSFSTRRVQAYQNGTVLMSMIASFQGIEDGAEHQESIDLTGLPDPESLPTVWEKYGHLADNGRASWVLNRPFDMRYVDSDIVLSVEKRTSASGSEHETRCPTRRYSTRRHSPLPVTMCSWSPSCDVTGCRGRPPGSALRASITRCGSTGPSGPMSGSCTSSTPPLRRAGEGWHMVVSTTETAPLSRVSRRRA